MRTGGVAEVKDIKRYEITIIVRRPACPPRRSPSSKASRASRSTADGHGLHLSMQGTADAVIKAAARYPVVSLTSHEPSLEDIFLRYYESDGVAAREATGVV